jgi:hypothetical protein
MPRFEGIEVSSKIESKQTNIKNLAKWFLMKYLRNKLLNQVNKELKQIKRDS